MKRLVKKLERIMLAVTFAEAGEHDTAREIMKEEQRPDKRKRLTPSERPRRELRA